MKLLLFIFGIIAAVTGGPVPSNPSLTENGLRSTAESLLREVNKLKNKLSEIEGSSIAIVKSKIFETEDVKALEAEIDKALESKKLTAECVEKINERFDNFVASISDKLIQNAVTNITGDTNNLKSHRKTLDDVESMLVTSLDQEIKICLTEPIKCKLLGIFFVLNEELFFLNDLEQGDVSKSIKMSLDDLASKDLQDKIKKEIIQPSQECLKA